MILYNSFLLKDIKDEVFQDYKKISMLISTSTCTWKCCRDQGLVEICQNSALSKQKTIDYPIEKIYNRYIKNGITNALIIAGLEPFDQFNEILSLIDYFRKHNCNDDIVIYSGYTEDELSDSVEKLKGYNNIIVKFGRFIMNQEPRYDEILGVKLASNNQYAKKIS